MSTTTNVHNVASIKVVAQELSSCGRPLYVIRVKFTDDKGATYEFTSLSAQALQIEGAELVNFANSDQMAEVSE